MVEIVTGTHRTEFSGPRLMNAGEIGTEAGRIFAYNLPSAWIFRDQEDQNDFGIDGEIELKDTNGKALGKESVFKVQIKGEEKSTYIHSGQTLSFTLTTERLKYYYDFKIPVILVVVEVSTQKIFWKALTIDEDLKRRLSNSGNQEYIQVHLSTDNSLSRGSPEMASKLLYAVNQCWDHLSILGIKAAVAQYPSMTPADLDQKINTIGNALYKAFHQQLDNLFHAKDYSALYSKASAVAASPVVPAEDRFIAALYYWQAFQISPHTKSQQDYFQNLITICHNLIFLARLGRSKPLRIIAIGKVRRTQFKAFTDKLFSAHHATNNFSDATIEKLIFNNETHQIYRACCLALQKLIDHCNRLFRDGQYHILSDLFIEVTPSIIIFQKIHEKRGTAESVEFLTDWHNSLTLFMLHYGIQTNNTYQVTRLFHQMASDPSRTALREDAREIIIEKMPNLSTTLAEIEDHCRSRLNPTSFIDASIDEQKSYFVEMAKNLGMDPDDTDDDLGQIVSVALSNYDPTDIMKECTHLFIDYRPAGIVAQSLQMHSAGGMSLLICLKHKFAMGTGGYLKDLYHGIPAASEYSFKNKHCKNCKDCSPRTEEWHWSLKWYHEAAETNKKIIETYRF